MTRPHLPAIVRTTVRRDDGLEIVVEMRLRWPRQITAPHYAITVDVGAVRLRTLAPADDVVAVCDGLVEAMLASPPLAPA